MGTFKQLLSFFVLAIMVFSPVISQANVSSATKQGSQVKAHLPHAFVQSVSIDKSAHQIEDASQNTSHSQHSGHCHCIGQGCCSFLVMPFVSTLKMDSTEKSPLLVSDSLYSWTSIPPTRPPSV